MYRARAELFNENYVVETEPFGGGTLAQLQHDVNQIWRQITQPTIQNYIRSMRQQYRAVIDANGGHTRY